MTAAGRAVETALTFLFVPGDRPERFAKARAAGADLVVVDLEDAVSPQRKDVARRAVAASMAELRGCAIRINMTDREPDPRDLAVVAGHEVAVMVPKAEPGAALQSLVVTLGPSVPVIALIETARGVVGAEEIARTPGVHRLALGTFDLAAELGIDPAERQALAWARQHLVLASAAAGLPGPVDGVTGSIADDAAVGDDAQHARRMGMTAKLCIHPRQLGAARAGLLPGDELVAWALRVMESVRDSDTGAVTTDGAMVDRPVVLRAERILDAAGRGPGEGGGTR